MAGRASNPKKAEVYRRIDENCRDCIYDDCVPGTWVQQVGACTIEDCALWPIRRVSVPKKEPAPQDAA